MTPAPRPPRTRCCAWPTGGSPATWTHRAGRPSWTGWLPWAGGPRDAGAADQGPVVPQTPAGRRGDRRRARRGLPVRGPHLRQHSQRQLRHAIRHGHLRHQRRGAQRHHGRQRRQRPRPPIPASLLPTVRSVPGVADAQPSVTGSATLLGADGKAVGGLGPPRSGGNWISDPALTPYRLAAGRAPQGLHEVVINEGAARAGHLRIGSATTVLVPAPVRVRVVGLATFGQAPGFGGATYVALSYPQANRYLTQGGVNAASKDAARQNRASKDSAARTAPGRTAP